MDPISLALIAAISAGVTGSVTDGTKASLTAGYTTLKKRLLDKIGSRHKNVPGALAELESSPASKGRQIVLDEEIAATQISSRDPELRKMADALLEQIRRTPGGVQIIHSVQNSSISNSGNATTYNIQGDQHNTRN